MRVVATVATAGALCLEAERVAPPCVRFVGGLTREGTSLQAAKTAVEKGLLELREDGVNLVAELCGGLVSFPLLRGAEETTTESQGDGAQASKEMLLVTVVQARNLQPNVTAHLVDCRNCGLQPDLFPIVTSRPNPTKNFNLPSRGGGFGRSSKPFHFQVCWNCGEESWQRVHNATKTIIASISCPRCALDTQFPHHEHYRTSKCDRWAQVPKTGPGDWACACCGHPEPQSTILSGLSATTPLCCSRCGEAATKGCDQGCQGHDGPVVGNIFLCCQADASASSIAECTKKGQRHHFI